MMTPLAGQWIRQEPSLSSVGRFDAGSISLLPPSFDDAFYGELLAAAGHLDTEATRPPLREITSQMVLVKAQQMMASKDDRAAARFVEVHRSVGDPDRRLRGLCDWTPQVVPYVHGLRATVRALPLARDPDGDLIADVWREVAAA